ncbi:MAG: hypothetical protein GWN99_18770 [Gemmatimonadetes bacterium]|nr:hypothetical protein [Gemmatimonadota bacterium]NIS03074.1 hypothetical protein [Gemmatimonadota bacterium]NIT68787.1 hypothetical protein [Gemmatimonadota bacterium]NIV23464.1 hypothetical protein [Gemmatimonadota bacterium]NIW75285.1 hypothetical protein [Gemmatimonadota bacterium]
MRKELKAILGAGALVGVGVVVGTLALGDEEVADGSATNPAGGPVVTVYKTPT